LLGEILLQQTQVSRVVQLWPSFLSRFPTLEALARAEEEEVVAAFAGLGYYRRARLLHRLAQRLVQEGWPRTPSQLAALPGLGPYTAAALAAFAFGSDEPPVDGNICRVAARVLASPHPVGSRALQKQAAQLAKTLAQESPPEVFEALMELGALVCRPQRPHCCQCPLQEHCQAWKKQEPTVFPRRKAPRKKEFPTWVALWVEDPLGRVLLQRVGEPPLLGLWLPPLHRGSGLPQERAQALLQSLGLGGPLQPLGHLHHHITHRNITLLLYRAPGQLKVAEGDESRRWWDGQEALPTSSLLQKMAHLVKSQRPQEASSWFAQP
jgi:A/G-specific adenine glycosylase